MHLFRQIGRLRHTETGEYEPKEHVSAQGNEFGLVVVAGYQGCTEPEYHINEDTCKDVEPEDSVVVLMFRFLQVDEAGFETT